MAVQVHGQAKMKSRCKGPGSELTFKVRDLIVVGGWLGQRSMLFDVRCWMLDVGCWMFDVRYPMFAFLVQQLCSGRQVFPEHRWAVGSPFNEPFSPSNRLQSPGSNTTPKGVKIPGNCAGFTLSWGRGQG